MRFNLKNGIYTIILLSLLTVAWSANAQTDLATFESFYESDSSILWLLAIGLAIIGGGLVYVSGGTATPVVTGIGTWIGGMMGLSGIAATNAGLALLGGGAIASGGFGIIGGTTLLTFALTFGTQVVIDYGINKAVVAYDYSKFAELSQKMTTLPLPKNEKGPTSFKNAMKVIKQVDDKASVLEANTQQLVSQAITELKAGKTSSASEQDVLREQSLLALLSFIKNDYREAKKASETAYDIALRQGQKATLPAFILATSSLYDSVPDFERSFGLFSYAVTNEKDYVIRALLFATFLDRVWYRLDEGSISSDVLKRINDLSETFNYQKEKAVIQEVILSRYFMRIKLLQQKILSL
jgi:hypothetical protein